jgi:hypothetical protein
MEETRYCVWCAKAFTVPFHSRRERACSKSCAKKWLYANSPEHRQEWAEAGKRGTETNRKAGFPTLTGGNGTGPSMAQARLAELLGWPMEVVVITDEQARSEGSPNHYKLDIACRKLLIAIEMDGETHRTPQRQVADSRKEEFLRRIGWSVYRFSNAQALSGNPEMSAFITLRRELGPTSPEEC